MSGKQIAGTVAATVIGGVILYFVRRKLDQASSNGGFAPVNGKREYYA